MLRVLDPFRFVLIAVAGWMNQWEYQMMDYLREENRVLREQFGPRRLRFNDDQRRRLAVKAKGLTRRLVEEMSPMVRGRPGPRWPLPSYFCAIRFRCQANKVSHMTWDSFPPEAVVSVPWLSPPIDRIDRR